MFDSNVFIEDSCRNVIKGGKATGFSLKTYITYYRGIPLSMVNDIIVKVNGDTVDRDDILFSADNEEYWFTLDEMETIGTHNHKWEYNIPAVIFVKKEGGLPKGEHQVSLKIIVRTAYIPVPIEGEKTGTVIIE